MSVIRKPLKDANFLSIYVFVYNNYVCDMCLHAQNSRCAKTWPSSYGACETRIKQCGSCILTTKFVTQTNYYESFDFRITITITLKFIGRGEKLDLNIDPFKIEDITRSRSFGKKLKAFVAALY
jgi:hypothetical protein